MLLPLAPSAVTCPLQFLIDSPEILAGVNKVLAVCNPNAQVGGGMQGVCGRR